MISLCGRSDDFEVQTSGSIDPAMKLSGSDSLVKESASFGRCTVVTIATFFSRHASAWSFSCQLIDISDFDDANEHLTSPMPPFDGWLRRREPAKK
jgi:hypothetical protein